LQDGTEFHAISYFDSNVMNSPTLYSLVNTAMSRFRHLSMVVFLGILGLPTVGGVVELKMSLPALERTLKQQLSAVPRDGTA
jgi:hypothetical protein